MDAPSHFTSLLLFCLATAGTPGPNNLLLTASGARFGWWRTVPHMLGILVGFMLLLMAVAGGLGVVFTHWPILHDLLKLVGLSLLLWLGWKIATAPTDEATTLDPSLRPFRFHEAAAFQFANPKAWLMCSTAVTTFSVTGDGFWTSAQWLVVGYTVVMAQTLPLWTAFGTLIARKLSSPRSHRVFNGSMGLLTGLSALGLLL